MYYQAPTVHGTGTFNTTINFTEASKYLAHVTLLNEGQRVDAHVAFKVGTAKGGLATSTIVAILAVLLAIAYIAYLSSPQLKGLVDGLLKKK